MKSRVYVVVVAVLLTAIFFLWPGTKLAPVPIETDSGNRGAPATGEARDAAPPSLKRVPPAAGADPLPAVRGPEADRVDVVPEAPPEQTAEWQITRQQAMLKALQQQINNGEERLRNAKNNLERETLQNQIEILRKELATQKEEMKRLQGTPTP